MKVLVNGALALTLVITLLAGERPILVSKMAAREIQAEPDYRETAANAIMWHPFPNDTSGAQIAIMAGDPTKPGLYTIRLRMPDGYKIMPHWHPQTEYTTVLSGTLLYGAGDKWEEAAMHTLAPSGFLAMTARTHHYAAARGETIVQVSSIGPAERILVN
jgi:quercetin dioxygenase-like cupin family protein